MKTARGVQHAERTVWGTRYAVYVLFKLHFSKVACFSIQVDILEFFYSEFLIKFAKNSGCGAVG